MGPDTSTFRDTTAATAARYWYRLYAYRNDPSGGDPRQGESDKAEVKTASRSTQYVYQETVAVVPDGTPSHSNIPRDHTATIS